MTSKSMSLKNRINNYAKNNGIAAQVVLQNYMFERFLERLSVSEYKNKFVIKGGMLIAAIVGLDTRSTMDLDTTIINFPLTETKVKEAVKEICSIDLQDDVLFKLISVRSIRKADFYGGFCARIDAVYDAIVTPLSIDVTTGDVITPRAVQYEFSGMFDDKIRIRLWGYNIETVLAEKIETILSRNIFNTRPRDFYDIYVLVKSQEYDKEIFAEALKATAEHRGSSEDLFNSAEIIHQISGSSDLQQNWKKYQNKFVYAREIQYQDIVKVLEELICVYEMKTGDQRYENSSYTASVYAGQREETIYRTD